ncbi:hypothetical protein UFOVP1041_12 [uncultured Caudovirales phage]|uniref:Uncharacterized protein n=1 Tax=uncultured Caudovirales phage TaxID=2100421 RepID=A0A6J5Q878_9CAUD|nr:hypothetical protein UFOVP1041_12 [uncultured Caudovirales phage]
MTYTYNILDNDYIERTDELGAISIIPNVETNADYQAYLNKDNPEYGKPLQL